ncbi:MAG: SPOR domain-containing protein [Bacteroidota bacterium]
MQFSMSVSQLRGFLVLAFMALYLGLFAQTSSYYHLINGSFTKLEDAKTLVADLKAKGYSPVILFPSGDSKYYRVSIYQSFDRSEVKTFADSQKARKKPTGWILTLGEESPTSTTANARLAAPAATSTTAKSNEVSAFHLVVGSFDDYAQADALVMALAQEQYEPYVIFPTKEGEKFRVSVYSSDSRREIEGYASMMKKRGKEKGWIYEEKDPAPNTLASARVATRGGDDLADFHLIGGSFKSYEQALVFADEMKAAGHKAVVLFPQVTKSNSFRVSIYQSDSQMAVSRYRKQLEKAGKAAGWVYSSKK